MSFTRATETMIEVMQAFVNGRPIEYRKGGAKNWEPCPAPVWDWRNYIYRAKPLSPDYIDWSPIAPRFEFCARDADGYVYVFTEKPYIINPESTKWTGVDAIRIDYFWQGIFTQGDMPWQDSLLMRNDGGC